MPLSLKRAKHFPAGQFTILIKGGFPPNRCKNQQDVQEVRKSNCPTAEKYLLIDPSNADMLLLLAESCALAKLL